MLNEKETFKYNLIRDFSDCENVTLNILDNYNVKNLKEDIIDFYKYAFEDTNINKLIFYFSTKYYDNLTGQVISDISNEINVDFNNLVAFFSMIFDSLNYSNKHIYFHETLVKAYTIKYVETLNSINSFINFISKFNEIGIEVSFKPYKKLNKLYLHGRYWISNSPNCRKGYLIDGSLNTLPNGLVTGQLMNEENYNIISKYFNDKIISRSYQYDEFRIDDLRTINLALHNYFNNRQN